MTLTEAKKYAENHGGKLRYSKYRYTRMSHGIHTWSERDQAVFELVKNDEEQYIDWSE
ncbi:hypothetical protein [Leuconostoc sp. S50]|nr:hypothetical protein [Leuconostoc sp. S50]MBK0052351.1 hypothetical protein [Leuconostoc sp. S50]